MSFLPEGPLALYLALGMVATVNPCGFAMLPAYLTYFLGREGDEASPSANVSTWQAIRVALAVSGGFLTVFAVAGLAVELTSLPVYQNVPWISIVIGAGLFGLGVAMLFGYRPSLRLPRLERGGRDRTTGSMWLFGVSYAVASIGCTLPVFLSVVAGTATRQSLFDGVMVFLIYGFGMTLVLVALTVATALARTSLIRRLRGAQAHIGRVAGGLVALAGAYVAYYGWLEMRIFGGSTGSGDIPASGITDVIAGWSSGVSAWVDRLGSVRIALALGVALAAVVLLVSWHRRRGRQRPVAGAGSPPELVTASPEPPARGPRERVAVPPAG